jgi:hypothetical protein
MNPFSPDYKGQLAEEFVRTRDSSSLAISQRATKNREKMRQSDDPAIRANGSGTLPWISTKHDFHRDKKIKKASTL